MRIPRLAGAFALVCVRRPAAAHRRLRQQHHRFGVMETIGTFRYLEEIIRNFNVQYETFSPVLEQYPYKWPI